MKTRTKFLVMAIIAIAFMLPTITNGQKYAKVVLSQEKTISISQLITQYDIVSYKDNEQTRNMIYGLAKCEPSDDSPCMLSNINKNIFFLQKDAGGIDLDTVVAIIITWDSKLSNWKILEVNIWNVPDLEKGTCIY